MKFFSFLVFLSAATTSLVLAAPQVTAAPADSAVARTSSSGSEVTGGTDKGGNTDKYLPGGWDRYSPKYCFHTCGFDYDHYHKKHEWDWEVRCFKRCLRRKGKLLSSSPSSHSDPRFLLFSDYDDHDWKAKRAEEGDGAVIQKRGLDGDKLKVKKRGYNDQNHDEDKQHRDHDYDRYRWCKHRKHRHGGHSHDDEGDEGEKGW